ncbi:cysteine hydrolase family protein [Jeotgalibaca ciconiae]|uniref:Cysteine hydrolase n=1 Tax=Jeotgalibaca ciconiae TaxID=2496265 RepID=A0A3Q9BMI9_9LACT|nr:isochorismatase family cysteine hydrolase [Jeotgalibaca ciconiae]AZP04407.1 cysteine hydrolase [Jeotgalibaca ciconiae]
MNVSKEALVIVDMSNDFVADEGTLTVGKPGQDIVPYIEELATQFLANGDIVVVSMDAHQPNDPHFDLWPPHNIEGTKGQQLYGDLYDWFQGHKDHEHLLYQPKANYNAFFQTELAEKLRKLDVKKVHVAGVTTDICDFLTIAGADAEGFQTVIHKRGIATFTDLGEIMVNHMVRCFHTEVVE